MREKELGARRRITPLTDGDAALATSWAVSPSWVGGALRRAGAST